MTSKITIQDYTDKSFVVRGNTTAYKDTLQDMGGKWNSRLTDKETGDKFGAWLFWTDKREEIEKWMKNGCPAGQIANVETRNQPLFRNDSALPTNRNITELHRKIDKLTKMVESLLGSQNNQQQEEIIEDDDEDTKTPPRLLLVQRKK